jgi:hypothetical protein
MTGSDFADRLTRIAAAAVGFALVGVLIVTARPAGGHGGVLPASLRFAASQDGAVAIAPAAPKPMLLSGPLRPGSHAEGRMWLRNQTGVSLAVGLRAKPSSSALDGIARVRITAGGEVIADTTLQALRQGTAGRVRLAAGAAALVRVRAWIPAEIETGYEGADVSVALSPVEASGR